MKKNIIATANAPAAIGPYSQAIDCGSFIVTSGQIPIDPAMNAVYAEFFTEGNYPARSAVEVGALPKGALVEIETICIK